VLSLIVCAIAGYGFEIYHSRGKDVVMAILMLAMMIPFAAIMIPLFRIFAQFDMVNSLFAVIIPSIATPLLILLFRQASRSFPYEVIEAARIDGLKELSIFARIYVPTMKSTFAAAAVITFMASWNNFLWPRVILLDNAVQTMPMLIANLTAGYVTDYGVLMLAVLLTSLPTILIFLILQRAFAQGITGAIK
jgi:lactose/L-arabinose transport system permease protein